MTQVTNAGWSLGNYCNARCAHCYTWQLRRSPRAIDMADADRILGQLAGIGVRAVNLGGNEPIFTHGPDPRRSILPDIVRRAGDLGMAVGVTTNGTTALLLAEQDPAAFAAVREWHVSLDSPFPVEHDGNRGGRYFALALQALALIRSRGGRPTIIYTVMASNASDAHARELFRVAARAGSDVRINTLKPTEEAHRALVPTPAQYLRFFRSVVRWSEPTVVGESTLAALWGLPSRGCPCGTTSLRIHSITAAGTVPVSPCVFLHQLKVGDLLTEELRDIVGRPEFLALAARRSQVPAACRDRDCPLLQACRGGCAARTLLHGTSREGPHDPPGNPGIAADLWAALHRPDPFCPADAIDAGNPDAAPLPCTLEVARESLRIHDGYLCTYIGTPRREPAWSAAPDDGQPAATPAPVARPRPEPFRQVA